MPSVRKQILSRVEKARVTKGPLASDPSFGNNGLFVFRFEDNIIKAIASDQMGWDHVSVSLIDRCPTWDEMCFIKDLFFEEEETVIQYHPPKSVYINHNPHVLHMWRNQTADIILPPLIMV